MNKLQDANRKRYTQGEEDTVLGFEPVYRLPHFDGWYFADEIYELNCFDQVVGE